MSAISDKVILIFFLLASALALAETQEIEVSPSTILEEHSERAVNGNEDAPSEQSISEEPPGGMARLESQREELSIEVARVGAYLDSIMGDTESLQDTNQSYLKVYLNTDLTERDGFEFKPKVRFRVDLPVTEEKFRLVFENETDQDRTLSDRILDELPSSESEDNDQLYGSLQYKFDWKFFDQYSTDVGIKARWPPDPFIRLRGLKVSPISDYWESYYAQEIFWFESRGLGVNSHIDFDRKLSDIFLFRETIGLDWREREHRYDGVMQTSVFHDVSQHQAFQYAIGANAEEDDGTRFTNYFAKVKYRLRLYKHWLFLETVPGVEFPRDDDFERNLFLFFKLEVLYATDPDRKLRVELH